MTLSTTLVLSMTFPTLDSAVVVAGTAAIGWIYSYFLRPSGDVVSAASVNGAQEVTIAVHGGYAPAQVRVKAGAPIRLVFDRQETSSCSEEVVFGDFGIRRFLPAFQRTVVELPPQPAGNHEFTCGMSMLRGTLIIE